MKTYDQLLQFYNENLHSRTYALEQERLLIVKFQYIVIAMMVMIPLLVMLMAYLMSDRPDGMTFLPLVLVFGIILAFLYNMRIYRDTYRIQHYQNAFKKQIINPLILAMDEGFIYTPDHCVSYQLVRASAFFNTPVHSFTGNDHIKGMIEDIPFQFSDIKLQQRETDSKGRVRWHTVFSGTFFVAEFNKHSYGVTIIFPYEWRNMAPSHTRYLKMDYPAFNKQFYVYGTDTIETHYLLTHSMMKRLMEIKKLTNNDLLISLADGCIYLAIDYGYDPNEAPINVPVSNRVIQYINTLQFIVDVIRDLQLNKKLWAKR